MDVNLNETNIILDGFVEVHRYRYLYFVIMFTVYIQILCFNSTIVLLIVFQRSLHEPMYIFIAALLLNNVMFSVVVYPKLLIDILSERQIISSSACFFQNVIVYSLGVSELFLLTIMSYDRYVSICKPLHYATIMRKRTVIILLVLTWILPAFYLSVLIFSIIYFHSEMCNFTLRAIICKSALNDLLCFHSPVLVIVTLLSIIIVGIFLVFLILFSYIRIIMIAYRSSKDFKRKAAQTCLPHLLVLISFKCFVSFEIITVLIESKISKTVSLIMTLQTIIYQPIFNPIIYGLKMKEIYKHLTRLLCRTKSK
ncbi:olfactory receptor 11A1-like [Melanotaenia boesemani]|uniref:olfactory receptor 11A1-like n=1 Tax=Melanotaenia boesemani TaxID=1250792 RepID=UPI001C053FDE|nr:olfactory receptor 11A1-like [Melanotaenia boesemani]